MKNSILITGATGFIGRHLIKKISNYSIAVDENGKNIDLRIRKDVLKMKRADTVIHLAAKIPSEKNYSKNTFFEHNFLGTLNILEYCVQKKIKKIIFVSSYVYGDPKYLPIDEQHPINPHNLYTKSKFLGEELCKKFSEMYDLNVTVLRPFNIFTGSINKNNLISNLISSIDSKKRITIINKNSKRDFLHIDDFKEIILKIKDIDFKFEVFNAGSGISFSFEQIIEIIEKNTLTQLNLEYKKKDESFIQDIKSDNSKIEKLLNWKPKITLEEGLQKLL